MKKLIKLNFTRNNLFLFIINYLVFKNVLAISDINDVKYSNDLNIPKEILEDSAAYEFERHIIITEDGYMLTVHHILSKNQPGGGQPVLIQHGLAASSIAFLLMGPNISLTYLLADLNYDVWLANSRGNKYSRMHQTFETNDTKFWDFSWHEMGIYDLPATIDYILNFTNYTKLHYIGHSQGCTIFFVMCSMKPEYNEKILSMQGFAPAVYLNYIKTKAIAVKDELLLQMTRMLDVNEVCLNNNRQIYCWHIMNLIFGENNNEMDKTKLPLIFKYFPAGCSTKQLKHFKQIIKTNNFVQFDYGPEENLMKYGQKLPPKYDVSKITVPIALYYSNNDLIVDARDIKHLYSELQNPIELYQVPMEKFNHIDYLWAIHVKDLVYDNVVIVLHKF